MNVTLRQMRYFEALAAQGHFGRAAEVCAVSQPALSMQIKELEAALGGPLFERGARQARLTRLGEAVAPRVRAVLQSVDELGDLARAARGAFAGRLNLGVIPTVAPYLLPRLIADLSAEHAELELRVRETLTARLTAELLDGRLDVAIVALPLNEPALTELALFEEPFALVRPLSEAGAPVPRGAALDDGRLLLLEEGHCFRDQALDACAARAARPRDGLDGSSLSTLVGMVGAGLGVTLIPEMAIEVEARGQPVDVARFPDPAPRRTIGLVWRRSHPLGDRFAALAPRVVTASGRPVTGATRPAT